ncbi:MAG TPA: rhomboid family intramembrane serine protease [Chitinophagales bacterium]|nr:rhomboid family intramembrane serine protease [Chitinophagales bacterium]HMX05503.1 rhomboid family intramembrane serine protease [Chitinophagales bacterium]HMZ89421.1 rhomboid family intramembrane serine protease [Chitinophagales bacterium]HNA56537.1 rhomboid family intramembrane serine protease [Chitinophagales bacterium]HNE45108.1 rhomboid family intramembrane serine protease [Chitinophagales bacterium]
MSQIQFTRFNYLPPVIKNLLIINGLVYLATFTFPELKETLALHYPSTPEFRPYQIVTHMFTHENFAHVFFNMFSLWMFGAVLENVWGPKRFLQYFLITGLGAALCFTAYHAYEVYQSVGTIFPSSSITDTPLRWNVNGLNYSAVGASGAIYGILVGFGLLFPNTLIYIYFLLPIKAKYLVIILIAYELYTGFINDPNDNVAHFAHLGGALIGFIMIKYWQKNSRRFY